MALFFFVDPTVSLFVGVGDLVASLLLDSLDFVLVYTLRWRLHRQAFKNLLCPVDNYLPLIIVLKELALILFSVQAFATVWENLIFTSLEDMLKVSARWVDHVEA